MGIFSGIGDFFGDVFNVVKDVGGAVSGFGGVASAAGEYFGAKEQQAQSQGMAREQMAFQSDQAGVARQFNSAEAEENRIFQMQMSNSAYQRAMHDMRSGGLNPILAYRQGGASSPVGSSASASGPSGAMGVAQNIAGSAARAGVSTAMAAKRLDADLENIEADTAKKKSERVLNVELTGRAGDDARLLREKSRNEEVIRDRLGSENTSAAAVASRDNLVNEFMKSDIGQLITKLGIGGKELNPLLGAGNSARSLVGR